MSENNYIVVCDFDAPGDAAAKSFREGDVLDEANARQWEPAGVLLLPVHAPHLPQRGATGSVASTAYQRHVYGTDGVPFEGAVFSRGCPVSICMPSSTARIEWMAMVSLTEKRDVGGMIRLASEESSHGHLGLCESTTRILSRETRLLLSNSSPPRSSKEVPVSGYTTVSGMDRCFGAVCLAGACVGVRVLWLALTVLPR